MPDLVIKGGTVLDAAGERRADVLIDASGHIAAIGAELTAGSVLDADGCVVAPGLVDLRARLGQPGNEQAETIESATRSAALGGYTAVVAMADTDPIVDSAPVLRDIRELSKGALCHVELAGAITMGRAGARLAPMAEMAVAGVKIFSDGDKSIQDARVMRRAMEYAGGLGVTLSHRCEDIDLAADGHMNEGVVSARLGIPGIPAEAEELTVMRDIALSRLTGARVHFQSLSTAGSLGIVRASKAQGLAVTADVTPHHLVLTDEAVAFYDARYKLSPPLRTAADVEHLRRGLTDGAIDAVATDHTPHQGHLKELPFDQAPAGAVGLETALAVAMSFLDLPLATVLALLSWQPARIAGVEEAHGGTLCEGRPANLTVIDPTTEWTVRGKSFASRSGSTPFEASTLTGRVRHTLVRGEAVVIDGEAQR
jgi:dihydroorotase